MSINTDLVTEEKIATGKEITLNNCSCTCSTKIHEKNECILVVSGNCNL